MMRVVVTGGAGFIGSALVRHLVQRCAFDVLVLDKLTYAGNLSSLSAVASDPRYQFEKVDICDRRDLEQAFDEFDPDALAHLAAETHVDRSIDGPAEFIRTNVVGTYELLEASLAHAKKRSSRGRQFKFLHVSTDEVFGALGEAGYFTELTRYDPRSPYSASKAASDHLVRAWGHTFGLPILITNCSNNYGPRQFPEKLIPLMIIKGLNREVMPVYGRGQNVRDWLFVEDHAEALAVVLERGRVGETYNIGGAAERRNIDVVHSICNVLDRLRPTPDGLSYRDLVRFVEDRPGHDYRYAINSEKLRKELGWCPEHSFESGLEETVRWYLDNKSWWQPLIEKHDADRRRGVGRL